MSCSYLFFKPQRWGRVVFSSISFILGIFIFSSCVTRKGSVLPAYERINSPVGERYLSRPSREEVDSLIRVYGTNKTLLEEYADILIVALSYYPELRDTHIKFEYSNEQTTMACRPSRLMCPRSYKVLINKNKNFDGIPSILSHTTPPSVLWGTNWRILWTMRGLPFWGLLIGFCCILTDLMEIPTLKKISTLLP